MLHVIEFGKQLIKTGDLDSVYIALHKSSLSGEPLARWIVAWMTHYHTGLCAKTVSSSGNFFKQLLRLMESDGHRGSQRVHHRGPPVTASLVPLAKMFHSATDMLEWIAEGKTGRDCYKRVMQLPGFGPCFAWRIPDIMERLGIADVPYTPEDVDLMYKGPVKGAKDICERYKVRDAYKYVWWRLRKMLAPPRYERIINIQEVETIFCKWKSHTTGRYRVGRDTLRTVKQLNAYPCSLNRELLDCLPWEQFDA